MSTTMDSGLTGHQNPHQFYIPVMGTAFTIDTPIRVAQFGISSVISLVDDILIEQMRKFHHERLEVPYQEIGAREEDSRARRITAFLDFVADIVHAQIAEIRQMPFAEGSRINRYFEMLPEGALRREYVAIQQMASGTQREEREAALRQQIVPGSIDTNIMTKLDRAMYQKGKKMGPEYGDAFSAFRGFAKSKLEASMIFSAGLHARLFSYISGFNDFYPNALGYIKKKIVLKVSDYRSALIQGKYLAKRGLWVSEYRIESGINCGGHAFISNGSLLGNILDDFRKNRESFTTMLRELFTEGQKRSGRSDDATHLNFRVTVQGGIGTADEQELLLKYYNVDATGWGTPFLLVPEVSNVDHEHREKLVHAQEDDVYLSDSSPLGISFWNLRDSASERDRLERIEKDRPGSPCPKGLLVSNTEFTKVPICHASRAYQKRKIEEIEQSDLSPEGMVRAREKVTVKSCICHDLAGAVTLANNIDAQARPAICCGPNIAFFSKIASLQEMVDHIYGRCSLPIDENRPHMFVRELALYVDFLHKEMIDYSLKVQDRTKEFFTEFRDHLNAGISHYRTLSEELMGKHSVRFKKDLQTLEDKIINLFQSTEGFQHIKAVAI